MLYFWRIGSISNKTTEMHYLIHYGSRHRVKISILHQQIRKLLLPCGILCKFLFCANISLAQTQVKIADLVTKAPLAGANVLDKQSQNLYISDENGEVSIPTSESETSLEISFIGYQKSTERLRHTADQQEIFLEPDYNVLEGIEVSGFESTRRITEIAGGFGFLPARELTRFNDVSLVHSMNTMPGVRMEERSPGSYRMSIRGSTLRSPFGVRNVKVYWNDIPFTEPSGSTPLNLMDLDNIDRLEVIKGPAGSIFGAGIGGVINMSGMPMSKSKSVSGIGFTGGSYGLRRFTAHAGVSGENHRLTIRYTNMQADGYRDHTTLDRKTLQVQGAFSLNSKQTLSVFMLYSDLYYELPGALNPAEFESNPAQARPRAAEQRSSIDNQNLLAGFSLESAFSENISNNTSIYISDGQVENPFILNYKQDRIEGMGGRTRFNFDLHTGAVETRLVAGAEYQYGKIWTRNYGNVDGYLDTLRFEDFIVAHQAMAFLQTEAEFSGGWIATAGGSINYVKYSIDRVVDAFTGQPSPFDKVFNPVFSPRLSLVKKINPFISAHASISNGFSPPTSLEIRTNEGSINEDLEAEIGMNYEIGIRGNIRNTGMRFDITTFWLEQKQTIISRTEEAGTVIFDNSGATRQQGLEVLLANTFLDAPASFVSRVFTQASYTYNHFIFSDYAINPNENLAGRRLTGTPDHILVVLADVELNSGIYLNTTFNFSDEIPLNDRNTVFAEKYHLLNAKLGYRKDIKGKMTLDVFAGSENLLNEKYSLGNDLNAFGNRFFSPAAPRNYYVGIKLMFHND
ncbi:MAG: TonB-dependent receptor [Cyclobacteriaceae bacterium]